MRHLFGSRRSPVSHTVTLYSRPGCHLCHQARAVVQRVTGELGVSWREIDITGDAELLERYRDKVPVTLVDDVEHDVWRVDERRLRSALGA